MLRHDPISLAILPYSLNRFGVAVLRDPLSLNAAQYSIEFYESLQTTKKSSLMEMIESFYDDSMGME